MLTRVVLGRPQCAHTIIHHRLDNDYCGINFRLQRPKWCWNPDVWTRRYYNISNFSASFDWFDTKWALIKTRHKFPIPAHDAPNLASIIMRELILLLLLLSISDLPL